MIVKRAKGVDSDSLVLEDYKKMYNMEIVNYAAKPVHLEAIV